MEPLAGCGTPHGVRGPPTPYGVRHPRYCTQVLCCTQVLHPGAAPWYCTQVLHPGAPPRYPCTQVLHPGTAPRCCTQVLHPGAAPWCGGHPPLTGCATPGTAPRYCTLVLHPGTPALRCCTQVCTQVPLHPGAAPRYCTPGCSNGPQGCPQVRRPAHRGAKMRFPRSARRNKNLTNSMSFRRGTRNSTKNARCSAA